MDVLVSMGTFAAYGYSIVFMIVSLATRGAEGADNEQFETAAMLVRETADRTRGSRTTVLPARLL
jgi:cation transport ATPase